MTPETLREAIREHPILFSTPMIQALLAGKKTQTRRVVKLRKGDTVGNISSGGKIEEYIICDKDGDEVPFEFTCPYGSIGDRLWVRETWADGLDASTMKHFAVYKASHGLLPGQKWRPSIFMPRWASRITLEITGVKVERVQEISGQDVIAEGVDYKDIWGSFSTPDYDAFLDAQEKIAVEAYQELWDKINGKRGYRWDTNPYIWAIEFK